MESPTRHQELKKNHAEEENSVRKGTQVPGHASAVVFGSPSRVKFSGGSALSIFFEATASSKLSP